MREHYMRALWRRESSQPDEGGTTTRRMRLEFPDEEWKLLTLTGPLNLWIIRFGIEERDTPNGESHPW